MYILSTLSEHSCAFFNNTAISRHKHHRRAFPQKFSTITRSTLLFTVALVCLIFIAIPPQTHAATCFGYGDADLGNVCSGPTSPQATRCDSTNYGTAVAAGRECRVDPDTSSVPGHPIRGVCEADNFCRCYDGWGGYNCALSECSDILYSDPNVCSGRGTCAGPNSCRCWGAGGPSDYASPPLYEGDNCEYPTCNGISSTDPAVCNGRAVLTYAPDPVHTGCYAPNNCDCNNQGSVGASGDAAWGYSGNDCEELWCANDKSPTQCGGPTKGTCVIKTDAITIGGRNRCQCKDGWASVNSASDYGVCDQPVCYGKRANGEDGAPCSGHGTCTAPATCQCAGIWTGNECNIHTCQGIAYNDPLVCNGGRGTCQTDGTCTSCRTGWQNGGSNNCEVKYCNLVQDGAANICSGHGQCNPNNLFAEDNQCFCDIGYEGTNCENYRCYGTLSGDPAVCTNGQGTCSDYNQCDCPAGQYTGNQCEIPICFGLAANDSAVCSNGQGTCTGVDTCVCNTGWTGNQCQTPICSGTPANAGGVCNSRGQCTLPDKCVCNNGYVGFNCELIMCYTKYSNDPQVCGGHGTCASPHTCSCSDNTKWTGTQCNVPKCYGIRSDDSTVCNGHGTCSAPDTCVCSGPGWSGNQCQTSICIDRSTSCSNHGDCNAENTKCVCDANYVEADCSVQLCFEKRPDDNSVCNGHGTCDGPDTCTCFDYTYSGDQCELPGCYGTPATDTANVCGGANGTCIAVDQCQCETNIGYLNSKCENPGCFGAGSDANLVCSQHGECVAFDDCSCEAGWGGVDCSRPRCFGLPFAHVDVCSGHGECTYADKCECESEYSGNNCQFATCFGVLGSDPYVCAGHGTCTEPNACTCWNTTSYSGFNCEQPGCFGVKANSPNVCFGRGECIAEDTCICEAAEGIGSNCEVNMCFGINATDARVCSRRGDCILPDHCDCSTGYGGVQCEAHYCYGILNTNLSYVCNSEGVCSGVDTCVCNSTHTGLECQYIACNGEPEDEYCNNHGRCANSTTCVCDTNYYGDQCTKMFEICENEHTIGTPESPCSSCIEGDDGLGACPTYVSEKWDLEEQRSGKMTLTGFYKVPDRPLDGTLVIDCVKVFSSQTLSILGEFAQCQWDSVNSDKFIVQLGADHSVESSSTLEFNMLPFDDDARLFSSSKADTSSSKTPVPDPNVEGPDTPGSSSDGSNSLWIVGIAVPASLIIIISLIICCLLCVMGCCVCIALRPRKKYKIAHNVENYYADPKVQARIQEMESMRQQREVEERRERKRVRLAQLNMEQDYLEERKIREHEKRHQEIEAEDTAQDGVRQEEEKLKLEKAKYARDSDRFTYEWDPISRRYVERLVDDNGERINYDPFEAPSQSQFANVADQVMLRSQIAPSGGGASANASDFLFAFENGILSRSLANRSLGWAARTRERIHGGGTRSPSPSIGSGGGGSSTITVEGRPESHRGSLPGSPAPENDQERLLSGSRTPDR